MIYENSVTYLNVANVPRAGATALDNLPVGAVAVQLASGAFNAAGNLYAGAEPIRLVQRLPGGQIAASPYFNFLTSQITRTVYAPGAEQVSYYGAAANGTVAGLGAITVGNSYILNVTLNHTQGIYNNSPLVKTIPYRAEANTQLDVARGLANSFFRSFKREPDATIRVERISDGVVATNAVGAARLIRVVNGSPVISYHICDATGVIAGTGTQAAGDVVALPTANGRAFTFTALVLGAADGRHIITIGDVVINVDDAGDPTENATAIAAAINASALAGQVTASSAAALVTIAYNADYAQLPPAVVSTDDDAAFVNLVVTTTVGVATRAKYIVPVAVTGAATAILDQPWQGPTGYVAIRPAGVDDVNHAGQTATGGVTVWGLMFSGIKQPFDAVTGRYIKTTFHVASGDFNINMANAQAPAAGNGTWEQVSELEVYAKFNEEGGMGITCKYPPTKYRAQAQEGAGYESIVINAVSPNMNVVTSGLNYTSRYNVVLCINSAQAAEVTSLATELGV